MIAILSDTHLPRGQRELPPSCVAVLEWADAILHAGDLARLGVLAYLQALAPTHAVRGNVDDREVARALPERLVVAAEGMRFGMVHDPGPSAGRHARLRAAFPGCDVIVYGHTHQPELVRDGGVWIVNPGSPTERRRAPTHTMAVVVDGVPRLLELAG